MADSSSSPSSCCNTCGEPDATARCGSCKDISYCNRVCQKADWKKHKKECIPPGATCTRCQQQPVIKGTPCNVPHPVHLLQDCGSRYGGGGMSQSYACGACHKSFAIKASLGPGGVQSENVYEPANCRWCFKAATHTVRPIPASDMRRVSDDILTIEASDPETVQSEIDAIPVNMPNVRILTITKGEFGYYDEDNSPRLNVAMPKLETLRLMDVAFSQITLNTSLTPALKSLEMKNIPENCDIEIIAPELVDFTMHFYGPAVGRWLNTMLKSATKLQSFESYKLRVEELFFASNDLRVVNLHRAELLEFLSLWAPKLQHLSLQACYNFEKLEILRDHALNSPACMPMSKFTVDSTNANLSNQVVQELGNNPRVDWDGPDQGDDGW
jgi:hypothetical protein